MKIDWTREWPNGLIWLAMVALVLWTWPHAGGEVPVHWGLDGEPDGFAQGPRALLYNPAMALGIYALLVFLPRLDPGRANYRTFRRSYSAIRTLILGLLLGLTAMQVMYVREVPVDGSTVLVLLLGLTFMVLGNLMGKLRPTFFVGIRTPWTLSSKRAWVRTHRLGGWAFTLLGLVMLLTALASASTALTLGGIGVLGTVAGLVAYSWSQWRRDPERIAPAGTEPSER